MGSFLAVMLNRSGWIAEKGKGYLSGRRWWLPISGTGQLTTGILAIDCQLCPSLILQAVTLILEGK